MRAELHQIVAALSRRDWEAALECLNAEPDGESDPPWTAELLEETLEPFFAEYGSLSFDHQARLAEHTQVESTSPRQWRVTQVLVEPSGDNLWHLAGEIDLSSGARVDGPLIRLRYVGV